MRKQVIQLILFSNSRLASKVSVGPGQYRNAVAWVRGGHAIFLSTDGPRRNDATAFTVLTVSKSPLLTFEASQQQF
jgi:hypothetical protein